MRENGIVYFVEDLFNQILECFLKEYQLKLRYWYKNNKEGFRNRSVYI